MKTTKNRKNFFKERKVKTLEDLIKAFFPAELAMIPAQRLEIELRQGYYFITILRGCEITRFCWDFNKKTINQQPAVWQGDYAKALGYDFYRETF